LGDRIFQSLCLLAGLSIIVIAVLLVLILGWQAWPTLSRAWEYRLFTSDDWRPQHTPPIYGCLAFVFGTLATSALAMLIAVPLGIGAAAFLAEIAPGWLRRAGSFLIELLAAVPSVVYGFWGMYFLRPAVQWCFDLLHGPNTAGAGILSAGLILSVMIIPYITAITFDVCRAVPRSQREGALALGASRWQMIWSAVLPYARPGIMAACFLALGRALGETMAVTMLIGNRPEIKFSIFAMADSIASVIANRLNEADSPEIRSALVSLGLILLLITSILNISGRLLIRRLGKPRKKTITPKAPLAESNGHAVPMPASLAAVQGEASQPLPSPRRGQIIDRIMTFVLAGCVVVTLAPLFLILGYIVYRGGSSLNWALFTELPKRIDGEPAGGLAHAMVGSAILVGLATLMAVPNGILTAIFLAETRNYRLAALIRFITEILGGVPSIVIGIFAYAVLVLPKYGGQRPLGFSAWAGAFALAVMMLPVVVRSAEEALRLVPQSLRQASYALGGNYWQTVMKVTLPAALPAVITGIILAASRIAGETAPLLLTAYGSEYMPRGLSDRTPSLPVYIYKYSGMPEAGYQQQAWGAALVLLTVIMVLNIAIRLITGRRLVSAASAD
jgi:phosphate transport system permease protein